MNRRALLLLLLVLAACGKKVKAPAAIAPMPPNSAEFVDLKPGWRLRIVAAVTKSGKQELDIKSVKTEGNVISLKVSDDFLGYETAFWSILPRSGGGVSLQLASATLTMDGKPSPITKPTRALISLRHSSRYVRAFYLTRKSTADHNMAIAGASRPDLLETFTKAFHDSPEETCADFIKQRQFCEWVPPGVAVRPEAPKIVDGVTVWPPQ